MSYPLPIAAAHVTTSGDIRWIEPKFSEEDEGYVPSFEWLRAVLGNIHFAIVNLIDACGLMLCVDEDGELKSLPENPVLTGVLKTIGAHAIVGDAVVLVYSEEAKSRLSSMGAN